MTWLKYKKFENDADDVTGLTCSLFQQFDDRLTGMRNYIAVFITGTTNLQSSNAKRPCENRYAL